MLNRSIAPAFSQAFSIDLPGTEVIGLPGGVDFVFLPGLRQELFKLEIVFRAGKWFEPHLGLAHFTAVMLDKGSAGRSSKEIAGVLDDYGAQIEISPGYDFVSVSLYGLKKFASEIFPVFMEILSDPVFPKHELDLQKKMFLQNLEVNERKNSFVASLLIRKNIFGSRHPYGSSIEKEHVAVITVDDLKDYFAAKFSPHEIYLIGNIEAHQKHWFAEQLSLLRLGLPDEEKNFTIEAGEGIEYVGKPESIQSSIRMGKHIINRGHKDYFTLLLLNHLLGGYFGSRLMKNIREEKGLTYGIYSSLSPFKNDCLFSIGADVDKANRDLTVIEIKKEMEALQRQQVSGDELDVAKNHLLGSIQLEMANPFSTFDKIKSVRLNQLGEGYYKNLFSTIKSVTPEALQGAAQKYFNANELMEVTVG